MARLKNVSGHRYIIPVEQVGKDKVKRVVGVPFEHGSTIEVGEDSHEVVKKLKKNYPDHFEILGKEASDEEVAQLSGEEALVEEPAQDKKGAGKKSGR